MNKMLVLGAVAYDPKVVTIWEGFKRYLTQRGLPFDFILFSNYERQVEALLAGQLDVAWNSPLAWVRAKRLATARGAKVWPLMMRDTDRDLRSVIVTRADSDIRSVADLRGGAVAVGASDSPQATLLPLAFLEGQGLTPETDFRVVRHEVLGGLHGDHVGGERYAAEALAQGNVDACCLFEANYHAFIGDGLFEPLSTTALAFTRPFDHCNLTVYPAAPQEEIARFRDLLLAMSGEDPEVRPLFELEGLHSWCEGRDTGYGLLEEAVDQLGFYDRKGAITARGYSY